MAKILLLMSTVTRKVSRAMCRLDHYQIRGWQSWHHHMALVMMPKESMIDSV